jgi:hypothetical protein
MMDSRPAIEFWRLETDDEELKTWENVLLPMDESDLVSCESSGMRCDPNWRMLFLFSRLSFSIISCRLSTFLSSLKWFLTPVARMLYT